ncbi:MAG: helix-turn-helix domain-containing protein, partial [Paracoccus sp. (in: a-proteobacteria)]|nr:helix-turn-helix domain-containing protein [Paracoccus sp. (in: a-proteobacteria)]
TALIAAMLIYALRHHHQGAPADRTFLALMADRKLAATLGAMLNEPGAPWTIDRLAERAVMSRASFLRRFSAATGRGPADVLLDIRIAHAARLLRASTLSRDEIINRVGYRSAAAFARSFRRRTGQTMTQMRRAAQPG